MSIAKCEEKIKAYADGHKQGNFSFVSPQVAEDIIRKFYGLSDEMRGKSQSVAQAAVHDDIIDLDDFLL